MTRPLTRRFAAPSPRFAGRGISREVLLPACGEKVAEGRMRGVIRSRTDGEGSREQRSFAPLRMTLRDKIEIVPLRSVCLLECIHQIGRRHRFAEVDAED